MPSNVPEIADADVAAYFAARPAKVAKMLFRLRGMVFDVAAGTPGVGAIAETTKWGEPSYGPKKPRVGSSVRLTAIGEDTVAVHFICHTGLVERFRELYPDSFDYKGNRSILLAAGSAFDEAALRHCIATALTYHLARRSR
ncbi:DUF1801 domain-containing protein [Mesorhizobium xinjiangense]|uniref:DUF1801 domain-containing protein n=1 Tax=Mesorhizobium xinjiangense TaxID=2678685 RepID=UPI001F358447|nr:DUF1801 domain-containing protein [Mesorhizobium xinjiangense]